MKPHRGAPCSEFHVLAWGPRWMCVAREAGIMIAEGFVHCPRVLWLQAISNMFSRSLTWTPPPGEKQNYVRDGFVGNQLFSLLVFSGSFHLAN